MFHSMWHQGSANVNYTEISLSPLLEKPKPRTPPSPHPGGPKPRVSVTVVKCTLVLLPWNSRAVIYNTKHAVNIQSRSGTALGLPHRFANLSPRKNCTQMLTSLYFYLPKLERYRNVLLTCHGSAALLFTTVVGELPHAGALPVNHSVLWSRAYYPSSIFIDSLTGKNTIL